MYFTNITDETIVVKQRILSVTIKPGQSKYITIGRAENFNCKGLVASNTLINPVEVKDVKREQTEEKVEETTEVPVIENEDKTESEVNIEEGTEESPIESVEESVVEPEEEVVEEAPVVEEVVEETPVVEEEAPAPKKRRRRKATN
jgi:hypothetical protein